MYKPKVFYTVPYSGKEKYQKEYDQISDILNNLDIDLYGTEIGNYKDILTKSEIAESKTDRDLHYKAIRKGINWADLIILEISHESFQVGHEATLALMDKKHVLGLSRQKDWAERIKHPYFVGKKYSKYNLKEIITEFIEKHSNEPLTERMNLFISKSTKNKLDRISKETGENMSEIVRRLIQDR